MDVWNGMSFEGKETMLRVVRDEAELFFAMVDRDGVWQAPTGAGHWEVRDVVAHLTDTTDSYFGALSGPVARGGAAGVRAAGDGRAGRQAGARTPGGTEAELIDRLRGGFDKMMEIFDALGPDDWAGLTVPHLYMGPSGFFYPAFQLMDYGVHSWDIRQGTGRHTGFRARRPTCLSRSCSCSGSTPPGPRSM